MARLPPPASLRDTDADDPRAPKRHRPREPSPASGSRRREPSPPPSNRCRAGRLHLPPPRPSKDRRRARSPPSKDRRRAWSPPSKDWRRARSPPYVSTTQRLGELQRAKRPSADAAADDMEEGEIAGPSPFHESLVESRPSHSHCNCKMDGKNQSGGGVKKGDPFIMPRMKSKIRNCYSCKEPGHFAGNCPYEKRDDFIENNEKRDDKPNYVKKGNSFIKPIMKNRIRNCYNCKEPGHFADDCPYEERDDKPKYVKRDAKPNLLPNPLNMKTNIKGCEGKAFIGAISGDEKGDEKEENMVGVANLAVAKPGSIFKYDYKARSKSACHKKMKRQRWAEAKKEMREMKKDKLLENIKKLQACIWLLEKDGADMAEIMKFRSLLQSTKKQYVENEAQLAQQVSSASQSVLNRDRLEKMHVEKMPAPVEKAEGDEHNMDCGKVEGRSLKGCKAVSEQNELAEEVNRLKSELEAVRQDGDYQLTQAQSLMADIAKQKEVARRYGVELEDAMRRVAALEEGCLLQRETI